MVIRKSLVNSRGAEQMCLIATFADVLIAWFTVKTPLDYILIPVANASIDGMEVTTTWFTPYKWINFCGDANIIPVTPAPPTPFNYTLLTTPYHSTLHDFAGPLDSTSSRCHFVVGCLHGAQVLDMFVFLPFHHKVHQILILYCYLRKALHNLTIHKTK